MVLLLKFLKLQRLCSFVAKENFLKIGGIYFSELEVSNEFSKRFLDKIPLVQP